MIRIVLDTNVVVSAHLKAGGLEDQVLRLVLQRRLQAAVSPLILDEYERVLRSAKLSLNQKLIDKSLAQIRKVSELVLATQTLSVCPDEADNRFLECAEAAGADYLVTGNKRHFPKVWDKIKVVTARELLEVIAAEIQK